MPRPASSETSSGSSGPRATRYQKFTVERWHRAEIKNAPYNPRVIDSYARKKLQANLKKVGLLDTLVVNRRSGNLVSGHQRLACLDALEGSGDYYLDVAVVELTDKQEREQNIFFNNPGAQGGWDVQALGELLREGLEIEATGFDRMDLEVLFDETQYANLFAPEKAPEAVQKAVADVVDVVAQRQAEKDVASEADKDVAGEADKAAKDAERIAAMKARREKFKADYNAELDTEFYLIVICNTREESERLLRAVGRPPEDRYVDGRMLGAKLGIDWSQGA